jgi:hypothetical protein
VEFALYWLGVFAIGLVTGVLSGSFGIGGATITTPFMRGLLGTSGHIALGTPLPIIVPTAASGALVYHKKKMVKHRIALACALPASVAAFLAATATKYFRGEVLMLITSAYIVVIAVKFALKAKPRKRTALRESAALAGVVGLLAGGLSGFLGVGGGIVLVPALTLSLGFTLHDAIGTSLLAMTIYSLPGSAAHFLLGHVDVGLLVPIALGSISGAQIGARFSAGTKERRLRFMFSGFLFLIAFALAVSEFLR